MEFFRNPEVKKYCMIYLIVLVSAVIINMAIAPEATIVVFLSISIISYVFIRQTMERYRKMQHLSENMNKILHGDYSIQFDEFSEGEIAILASEIYKMTIALREQNDKLTNEKRYLADSIADISHQLRTPLTSMNVITTLLNKPEVDNDRRLTLNHELIKLVERMEWHIGVLLKISKIDSKTAYFVKEKASVGELINRASEPLLISMELKQQEFIIDNENDEIFYGDLKWTTEAIANILKNCLEHTPEGGRITVVCSSNPLYTEIIISDNGTGIDDEDKMHIFERFYKGKNSSENSYGIGLALARMIICEQNGTIKVYNNEPKGTCFEIRFYYGAV